MTEMSKDNKTSKALPKALVDDEEQGVANAAAGKDEQPKPRNYKWLAVFFMSVALVSIAIVTKSVGAYTQKHVYAVSLASRLDGEPLQRKASFDGRHLQQDYYGYGYEYGCGCSSIRLDCDDGVDCDDEPDDEPDDAALNPTILLP